MIEHSTPENLGSLQASQYDHITPVDLKVKDLIRQFFKTEMDKAKVVPGMQHAITIKEMDFERVLDNLWLYINKGIYDQRNTQQPK